MTGNPNDGTIAFRNADGRTFTPPGSTVGDPNRVSSESASLGIAATADTITPRGHGERYVHDLTIWITTNDFNPDTAAHYQKPIPAADLFPGYRATGC